MKFSWVRIFLGHPVYNKQTSSWKVLLYDIYALVCFQKTHLLAKPHSFISWKQTRAYILYITTSREEIYILSPPIKTDAIESAHVRKLQKTYGRMYAARRILHITSFSDKFKHLLYKSSRYTSDFTAHQQVSTVFLQWFDNYSRPAVIREFLQHDIVVEMNCGNSCLS